MIRTLLFSSSFLLATMAQLHAADFREEMQAAMAEIDPIEGDLERLMIAGKLAEANARLLATFPEKTRTPAQSNVLGNMLYSIDPALSYRLHQDAANRQPDDANVQLEWAMEQHRVGEYAGALTAYEVFSKKYPDYAPVHGVAAECLLRLGRISEAVKCWQRSEAARTGKLTDFEKLVYEIHGDHGANLRRADLRAKVEQGSVDAAIDLIVLDSDFPFDWWNGGVHRSYLTADLPELERFPAGDPRITAAKCLGTIQLLAKDEEKVKPEDLRRILLASGLIVDERHTLGPDHAVNALLIAAALNHKLITKEQADGWFGAALLTQAATSQDVKLWNLIAFLATDTTRLPAIEKDAWKATGDARFAAAYLLLRHGSGELKADDPELLAAAGQFPESAEIAYVQVACTSMPDAALLVRAITAEYRHFSSFNPAGFVRRPGAWALRSYFKRLAALNP